MVDSFEGGTSLAYPTFTAIAAIRSPIPLRAACDLLTLLTQSGQSLYSGEEKGIKHYATRIPEGN